MVEQMKSVKDSKTKSVNNNELKSENNELRPKFTTARIDLVPTAGIVFAARAMEAGLGKYKAYDWTEHKWDTDFMLDKLNHAYLHLMSMQQNGFNDTDLGHAIADLCIIAACS